MKTVTTVKGIPRGRSQITPLQREVLGRMIDAEIYSYEDLAKFLKVSTWTLSKTLRGRRGNPKVLKKLLGFLGKDPTAKVTRMDSRVRGNDGRRTAA